MLLNMAQLENIESIERRLWSAADTLRANSGLASNEYFIPVMGLIFLRHAYNRFLKVKEEIEGTLPSRGGKVRELTKEDFSQKTAIFLRTEAQFDYLVNLPDEKDRAQAIIDAMKSIENDYDNLKGVLPKSEYRELTNDVLGNLLRTLNPEELKRASGDIFGRIYEYFLTQFADLKAHDNGEFFTPVSLVSLIANVIEPNQGTVIDPACGSGGMFVQSAHFVERLNQNPTEKLTFRGLEKNSTTIRLAKMNLAVHGLEGDIQQAITYYEDPHELYGKADFLMANPPFNVDEVDADKVKNDPRLPFGLPGVNKKGKVSNGNYLWISYFYSYLNEHGRSGFVMSSQASSAGGGEAKVRQKLVETGHVDIMIAIRSNFFYTRTVPCELWFLNRGKPEEFQDKVLMIDARNIYRKVTRKIYDFSPEQQKNILAIVWLYRGQTERYLDLVSEYCEEMLNEAGNSTGPLDSYFASLDLLHKAMYKFIKTLNSKSPHAEIQNEFEGKWGFFEADIDSYTKLVNTEQDAWKMQKKSNGALKDATDRLKKLADFSRDLVKQADLLYKLGCRLIDTCEGECGARESDLWIKRDIDRARKDAETTRQTATEQLKLVRYFFRHARWLTERFPDGKLVDFEGLVKLVDRKDLKDNDWSLTPGRYVGVAPEEETEDFDFEEALRDIHVELESLNTEATDLAEQIAKNFEELGI